MLKLPLTAKFRSPLTVVLLSRETGVADVFASSRLPNVPPPLMVCAIAPLSTIFPVPVARPELKMFPETFRIFPPSLRVPATRFNAEETFTVF